MLAIDETPTAGVEDARLALEAARAALAQLERERKDLPARHREAVQRGDFASAREKGQ
jgi:hypothetical protein